MRVGVFGAKEDPRCRAVAGALRAHGGVPVRIHPEILDSGHAVSSLDGRLAFAGADVDGLSAVYVAAVPSPWAPALDPLASAPSYERWFIDSMQARERASLLVAWLLSMEARGVRMVNAPRALAELEYPAQRHQVLRDAGAPMPRTLISNEPDAIRDFLGRVGRAVRGPLLGAAPAEPVDAVPDAPLEAPALFQEVVEGEPLRLAVVGDAVLSSAKMPGAIEDLARACARRAGLVAAGLELRRTSAGAWLVVDLDPSPGAAFGPVADSVAHHLLGR